MYKIFNYLSNAMSYYFSHDQSYSAVTKCLVTLANDATFKKIDPKASKMITPELRVSHLCLAGSCTGALCSGICRDLQKHSMCSVDGGN